MSCSRRVISLCRASSPASKAIMRLGQRRVRPALPLQARAQPWSARRCPAPCPGSGVVIGRPFAGLRMLLLDSIRIRASACASALSGRCTAIWSPSKSALNAVQTSGWIWMALPSISCGSNAWMPRRCSVGRPVEQHRVLGDDLLEHVPDDRAGPLDHPLGALDVLRVVQVDQALHHERLEQLQRHALGQAALVQLELRTDDDDRTAGVVDALAEQVLPEPALLALEHVATATSAAGCPDR